MSDKTITIPLEQFDSLCRDEEKLAALEMAGVDNWEGYDEAMRILREMRKENE